MAARKNDLIGVVTSLVLHALLLLLFGAMSLAPVEPEPIGYIEVDFGPLAQGRSVQEAVEEQPETPDQPEEPRPEQPRPQAAPPQEAKPVELPKQTTQVQDPEQVETPESETISPTRQSEPTEVQRPEPQPEEPAPRPLGGGARDGTTGAADGDAGEAADERRTAPFQIEGLNRRPMRAPLPSYADKVNAVIKVRVVVNPQGRVVGVIPDLKGNPALEREIERVLRNEWRFNNLPANAPQENQTGFITFRFRLE